MFQILQILQTNDFFLCMNYSCPTDLIATRGADAALFFFFNDLIWACFPPLFSPQTFPDKVQAFPPNQLMLDAFN